MKPRLRKSVSAVALLIALVFALSGCIHMNMSLNLNKDDSVDWSYEMLMSDALMGMVGDSGTDPWADSVSSAEAEGFTVEKVPAKDGYSGIKVTKHYASIDEFNKDTKKLSGTESTAQGASADISLTKVNGKYTLKMNMDVSQSMAAATSSDSMDEASKKIMDTYLKEMQFNFVMKLPFKAESNNATSVSEDGLTYTWKIDMNKPNSIELTAKTPMNLLLIGGIAAAGVILIAAVVLIVVGVSKKKKAAIPAEPQFPQPPQPPMA